MPAITIHQGENHMLRRKFTQADGTPLDFSAVLYFRWRLEYEDGTVIKDYEYTAPSTYTQYLTHLGSCEFQVQLTMAQSSALAPGNVFSRFQLEVTNSDFTEDDKQIDIFKEHTLTVVDTLGF